MEDFTQVPKRRFGSQNLVTAAVLIVLPAMAFLGYYFGRQSDVTSLREEVRQEIMGGLPENVTIENVRFFQEGSRQAVQNVYEQAIKNRSVTIRGNDADHPIIKLQIVE